MGAGERSVIRLRGLRHFPLIHPLSQRRRQLLAHSKFRHNALHVGDGRRVRQGRSRRQRGFLAGRYVRHGERDFGGASRGDRQPAAFHCGDVLPHRIHLADRGAARDQHAIELLHLFQRQLTCQRQFHQRGAAARQQKKHQRLLVAISEQRKN